MTQQERREYLIRRLLRERPEYESVEIPPEEQAQKDLLRALMNVRPPEPVDQEFLSVQDEYLTARRQERGVVDGEALPTLAGDHRLALWQGDVTTLKVDAIVNAANSRLLGCFYPCHGCIDNIIHTRAGVQLRLKCAEIMARQGHDEPIGQAKITPGYNLPCKYVLHTVGPVVTGHVTAQNRADLTSCYRSCLELAAEHGLKTIAFCCISTGEFHFPQREAAEIAVKTVKKFLQTPGSIQRVIFNVFKDSDQQIYRELLGPDEAAETGH